MSQRRRFYEIPFTAFRPADARRVRARSIVLATLLLCGALSPAIYAGADLAAAARYPGYSVIDQAVSELFAIGAPTSSLVVPLFTASSGLLLAFAGGVWWIAGRNRWLRLLAFTLAASALDALVLWNFFPMHMRGAERTATDTMHLILAANPSVPLSLVFGAAAFAGRFRAYTVGTLLLLTVLAAYGFSFADAIAANAGTPGLGLSERLAQYSYGLWEVMLAIKLWRAAGGGRAQDYRTSPGATRPTRGWRSDSPTPP